MSILLRTKKERHAVERAFGAYRRAHPEKIEGECRRFFSLVDWLACEHSQWIRFKRYADDARQRRFRVVAARNRDAYQKLTGAIHLSGDALAVMGEMITDASAAFDGMIEALASLNSAEGMAELTAYERREELRVRILATALVLSIVWWWWA